MCNTCFAFIEKLQLRWHALFPFLFSILFFKYEQMKGVFERTKQTHAAMIQKVKDALQQRDDMKMHMEEAFITKEAVGREPLVWRENCCVIVLPCNTGLFVTSIVENVQAKHLCSYFESSLSQPNVSCSLALPWQTLSAMDQLRAHCAKEISELDRAVGSQQELSAALDQTYPQLVRKIRHVALCVYSMELPIQWIYFFLTTQYR